MPEGPEIYLACQYINRVCADVIFGGKVIKSEISKNSVVAWNKLSYTISATSRGKELKLALKAIDGRRKKGSHFAKTVRQNEDKSGCTENKMDIIFRFGMSGRFQFDSVSSKHKHAHLNFYSADGAKALSFIDPRRFGRWEAEGNWSVDRGPCVLTEYEAFRKNVVTNVGSDPIFTKPLCEVLLNQKYFNGIGNYLRAEILYRAGVAPFVSARSALESLGASQADPPNLADPIESTSSDSDLLHLCHLIPKEVTELGGSSTYNGDVENPDAFSSWLRCYDNKAMKRLSDHNGRTIWFSGEAGSLAPRRVTGKKTKKRKIVGEAEPLAAGATGVNQNRKRVKKRKITENSEETISVNNDVIQAVTSFLPNNESEMIEISPELKVNRDAKRRRGKVAKKLTK